MKVELKNTFNVNVSYGKCKRAKRLILEITQKGLIETVQNVLPDSHHRFCVKHIEANWCKRWRTDEFKKLLWWSAWSSYEEDFKDQLKSIGELSKEADESLLMYPPRAWCRAYFDTMCKNQKVENNFTESVNAWLVEASPHSLKIYNEYFKIGTTSCYVDINGDNGYEVREGTDKYTVNMVFKKCTCRGWDLTGIPCPHEIKALQLKRLEPMNEINWWYSKEAYLLTNKYKLQLVRGEKFWELDPSQTMEPPEFVKMAGRPKIKRTRQKDEAIKRQGE
ncbi:uncharacterized protein LOC107802516 [Nicotiana tabacum]|uniref:Uncharacterized protein LOC107802516 n=2 Tax=Nicotiana TaxID=4085 RepID=A0AC58USQ8_TOBAC|nr:PREDICTED: uncharacterized protein LOC104231360 [Nicotiana sylvestris]